jgi:uncharacterized protein with NRDE domain
MCLLFFSYKTTPGYRLVVAANRDEFLSRPTAPLGFLNKEKTILGGLDLQGGGTWLGITSKLKFAALTNYRESASTKPDAPSRGEILNKYLAGSTSARQYMDSLVEHGDRYNGFNLILGDSRELYYYSNRLVTPTLLGPGFYGLSNHLLDTPWPKVVRGKSLLRPHMVETGEIDVQRILALLGDTLRPPDEQLPETGVGLEWERLLSSIFIDSSGYGTRSSAVITVSDEGYIDFVEKSLRRDPLGQNNSETVRISLGDE